MLFVSNDGGPPVILAVQPAHPISKQFPENCQDLLTSAIKASFMVSTIKPKRERESPHVKHVAMGIYNTWSIKSETMCTLTSPHKDSKKSFISACNICTQGNNYSEKSLK